MYHFALRILLFTLAFIGGCSSVPQAASVPSDVSTSVWSVDLVRTLPGAQADYLHSIETNWANARRLALERGAVRSYRALVTVQDTVRTWDVILMTEYVDSLAWVNREEIFQSIFTSPEFVSVEAARPSADMRSFLAGGVVMRAFVSEP